MKPSSPKQTVSVKYQPQDSTKSTVEICRPLNSNPPLTDPKNSFSTQNSDPTVAPNLQLLLLLLCTPSYSNFHSAPPKKNTIFSLQNSLRISLWVFEGSLFLSFPFAHLLDSFIFRVHFLFLSRKCFFFFFFLAGN